jgi:hypothetical protein
MNYHQIRRRLAAIADVDPGTTKWEANRIIADSVEEAYREGLDCMEKAIVRKQIQWLQDNVHGLGERGALELLAAVSEYLPEGREE